MNRASGGDDWMDVDDAPIAWDEREYVVAGKAVEEYLDEDEPEGDRVGVEVEHE